MTPDGPCVLDSDCGGGGGGGGGGDSDFILACEDFGRMFDHSFPVSAFFFLKWRLARAHLFYSVPGSVSPQWLCELRRLWLNVP